MGPERPKRSRYQRRCPSHHFGLFGLFGPYCPFGPYGPYHLSHFITPYHTTPTPCDFVIL